MLAIALALEGWSRQDAAAACAMDRQTLRDWVHRYNEAGLDGLRNRSRRNGSRPACPLSGRPQWRSGSNRDRSLSGTALCAGAVSICSGGSRRNLPLPCTRAPWASCCTSRISPGCNRGRIIRRKMRPRKRLSKNLASLVAEVVPAAAAGKPLEIWFADEARVGQQGTLTYVWHICLGETWLTTAGGSL